MAQLTTSYQRIAQGTAKAFGSTTSRVDIYAKYNSQSIANNTTNYSVQLRLVKVSGRYIGEYTGTTVKLSSTGLTSYNASGGTGNFENKTLCTITGDVLHSGDGTKSISASGSMYFKTWGITISASGSATLPTIPRKANITSFSVSKRDETSVTFNWSADATCDAAQYSKDNGSTWASLPANNIVTGLSAGQSYNFKLQVRRQDSQLWSDPSETVPQSTYPYPSCASVNKNFTIGENVQLTFNNPLNRQIQIQMWSHVSQQFVSDLITISGTTYNFNPDENRLFASIPNTTESKYNIDVWYSGNKAVQTAGTYYLDVNNSKPLFEDFDYSTDLSDLTGNNNTIINNRTNATITISSADKAIGQNGATIQRYSIQCGAQTSKLAYYSDSDVSVVLNNCNSDILKVTAIDSRNLETTVTKTVPNFKNYFIPTFMSFNIDRENGIDTTAYLDTQLEFWNDNFGNEDNEIQELNYRVKEQGTENWSNWFTINPSMLVVSGNRATLTNYLVYLDGISEGFVVGKTYNVQLQVIDGTSNTDLSTVESPTFNLTDGKVAFSILKDNNGEYHIGINGMPDLNLNLKVHGTSG